MIIDLQNINFYFLNCDNEKRKIHMINEFKKYNIIEVNPIKNIGKNKSGSTGFSKILDLACINQDRNKPFQPFVIFEDDVIKYREFPNTIKVPDNTDILYIGLSKCAFNNKKWCHHLCCDNINNDIIRIYNMLSFHGVIVCSMRALLALQKCFMESYFKDIIWDIFTAQMQAHIIVYALKIPLVYQYSVLGGLQGATKIEYSNIKNKTLPKEWKNNKNISIITNYI